MKRSLRNREMFSRRHQSSNYIWERGYLEVREREDGWSNEIDKEMRTERRREKERESEKMRKER